MIVALSAKDANAVAQTSAKSVLQEGNLQRLKQTVAWLVKAKKSELLLASLATQECRGHLQYR